MATTSPDNLWSPNNSDSWGFVPITAAMQSSVQKALTSIRNSFTSELDNMQSSVQTALTSELDNMQTALHTVPEIGIELCLHVVNAASE